MKKKKYNRWLGDDDYRAEKNPYHGFPLSAEHQSKQDLDNNPKQLFLDKRNLSGFFLGRLKEYLRDKYCVIPQGTEGNMLIIGGNGSGKSSGIVKPTLKTWQGSICATDIKGELSDFYAKLYEQGLVERPYIIFNPQQIEGIGYDPFWWIDKDGELNIVGNIQELVLAIIPIQPYDIQPFWVETERGVFASALLYYYRLGISFSEAINLIVTSSLTPLVQSISDEGREDEKMFLGELANGKPETLANFDRGLRNKLIPFAADLYINHAFRGKREGANCFTWDDLERYNIFLRIPAEKIEQWGAVINLMYTQLIRHLERRPDKYSQDGRNNMQTLLLMDEFARFGKLDMITSAVSTLRSKNVNICLVIQSIAQLDKIYGEYDRRIIFDNCQFQAILRVNDAETQRYCCDLIGTKKGVLRSFGDSWDDSMDHISSHEQSSETLEWTVPPHTLSGLKDILLLTPYGFCRVEKVQLGNDVLEKIHFPNPIILPCKLSKVEDLSEADRANLILCRIVPKESIPIISKGDIKMLTLEKRTKKAREKVESAKRQEQMKKRNERDAQQKKDKRRKFIIGGLVTQYFPEIMDIDPGSDAEWDTENFKPVRDFLSVLSADRELVKKLKERAANYSQIADKNEGNLSSDCPNV